MRTEKNTDGNNNKSNEKLKENQEIMFIYACHSLHYLWPC